jgi:hypothetical protein
MEVVLFLQDQWCSHMVDVWARCLHSSSQTHPWIFCTKKEYHVWARCLHSSSQTHPWIFCTKKEYHVDMAQHLVREECKSRIHILSWQLAWKLLLQWTKHENTFWALQLAFTTMY